MIEAGETDSTEATVLIVDDNEKNRLLIETIIRTQTEYKTILAADGPEALARAAESPPDLVLLDVLMPGIDGYEVAKRFKENPALRDVPIIFITALSEIEDKVKAFERGGIDYIVKPIEPREVLSRVTAQVNLRLQNKEIQRLNGELNRQIDLAKHIQQAIMPIEAVTHSKAVITGRCLPLDKVSGDYFDILKLDDDVFLVFLADIMGHGIPAALYTMMLKTDLYYLTRFSRSPGDVLSRLNERLCQVLFEDFFITACLFTVDLSAAPKVVYASAGHPPAIMVSGPDGPVSSLQSNDLFLGWKPKQQFTDTHVPIMPGSSLFLHTDGFRDAIRTAHGIDSPVAFLEAALARGGFQPQAWLKETMDEFQRNEIPTRAHDDVSIICIEFQG